MGYAKGTCLKERMRQRGVEELIVSPSTNDQTPPHQSIAKVKDTYKCLRQECRTFFMYRGVILT